MSDDFISGVFFNKESKKRVIHDFVARSRGDGPDETVYYDRSEEDRIREEENENEAAAILHDQGNLSRSGAERREDIAASSARVASYQQAAHETAPKKQKLRVDQVKHRAVFNSHITSAKLTSPSDDVVRNASGLLRNHVPSAAVPSGFWHYHARPKRGQELTLQQASALKDISRRRKTESKRKRAAAKLALAALSTLSPESKVNPEALVNSLRQPNPSQLPKLHSMGMPQASSTGVSWADDADEPMVFVPSFVLPESIGKVAAAHTVLSLILLLLLIAGVEPNPGPVSLTVLKGGKRQTTVTCTCGAVLDPLYLFLFNSTEMRELISADALTPTTRCVLEPAYGNEPGRKHHACDGSIAVVTTYRRATAFLRNAELIPYRSKEDTALDIAGEDAEEPLLPADNLKSEVVLQAPALVEVAIEQPAPTPVETKPTDTELWPYRRVQPKQSRIHRRKPRWAGDDDYYEDESPPVEDTVFQYTPEEQKQVDSFFSNLSEIEYAHLKHYGTRNWLREVVEQNENEDVVDRLLGWDDGCRPDDPYEALDQLGLKMQPKEDKKKPEILTLDGLIFSDAISYKAVTDLNEFPPWEVESTTYVQDVLTGTTSGLVDYESVKKIPAKMRVVKLAWSSINAELLIPFVVDMIILFSTLMLFLTADKWSEWIAHQILFLWKEAAYVSIALLAAVFSGPFSIAFLIWFLLKMNIKSVFATVYSRHITPVLCTRGLILPTLLMSVLTGSFLHLCKHFWPSFDPKSEFDKYSITWHLNLLFWTVYAGSLAFWYNYRFIHESYWLQGIYKYVPHLATSLAQSYGSKTNLDVFEATAMPRLSSYASMPIWDVDSDIMKRTTKACVFHYLNSTPNFSLAERVGADCSEPHWAHDELQPRFSPVASMTLSSIQMFTKLRKTVSYFQIAVLVCVLSIFVYSIMAMFRATALSASTGSAMQF